MTKEDFISHLIDNCGCILVREDKRGYAVVRNVINGEMSGVPANSPTTGKMRPATICRICKTLDVEIPDEARKAIEIIEVIHENHKKREE